LLIVVAIILIIAAIAIPNLLRARISANESSAAASVRSIVTGEISYFTAYPAVGYTILANLGTGGAAGTTCPAGGPTAAGACYIDSVLANGTKSGYNFAATGLLPDANGVNQTFSIGGVPVAYNTSGVRAFCSVTDGVVKVAPNPGGAETLATAQACAAPPYAPLQ